MGKIMDLGQVIGLMGPTGPTDPAGPTGPAGTNATTTDVATVTSDGLMSANDKNILYKVFYEGLLAYYGYSVIYSFDTNEVYGFVFYDVEHNIRNPVTSTIYF